MSSNRNLLSLNLLIFSLISVTCVASSFDYYVEPFSNIGECESFFDPPSPREVPNWPRAELNVGFIVAVAVNTIGNPVIFHRGEQERNAENAFDDTNHYNGTTKLILATTVVELDAATGLVRTACGSRQFVMPHSLTIDQYDRYWLTDLAFHQMLMYDRMSDIDLRRPALVLGQPGRPGPQLNQLCKPTAVAVASNDEFYVSDGYCNSRILKFDADGCLLHVYPQDDDLPFRLVLPHALALVESEDRMCICDRAQRNIICASLGGDREAIVIDDYDLGHVYSVAADGPYLYVVNGPIPEHTFEWIPCRGFTIDTRSGRIVDRWGHFNWPHSLAISVNRTELYMTEVKPKRIVKFELNYE